MKNVDIKTPESHLVTLASVNDPVHANLVRNTLLDHDIQCQLGGGNQGGFAGAMAVEILVRQVDVAEATKVLKIHHPEI